MRRKGRVLTLGFVTVLATACGRAGDLSSVKLVNGTAIPHSEVPAAVQVTQDIGDGRSASCTATWVSDHVLLTAAHCVEADSNTYISQGVGQGVQTRIVLRYPRYGTPQTNRQDVAIVVFPRGTSSHWLPVAQADAHKGDVMTIIGFGHFDHGDWGSGGVKRKGFNAIDHFEFYEHSLVIKSRRQTSGAGTGQNVLNAQGDSGGPMIYQDQVYGVASTVGIRPDAEGYYHGSYANLRQSEVWAWLVDTAAARSIEIRGINLPATAQ